MSKSEELEQPLEQQPQNVIDITQMTIEQLKALAYDQVVLLERTRQNLAVLQAEIDKRK